MVHSEQAGEGEWGEGKLFQDALHPDCAVGASRAPFLSLSPLLPVTDDTTAARRIWENTFTSGQTCPGPRPSPRTTLLPVPAPIQSIQSPTPRTFFTWLLVSWFHSSPCSGTFLPLSFLFFKFFYCEMQCDWEPYSLCRGKGEICESMMSWWRRGSLRIVLYWMCQAEKKMCQRKITHPGCYVYGLCPSLPLFLWVSFRSLFFSEWPDVKPPGFCSTLSGKCNLFGLSLAQVLPTRGSAAAQEWNPNLLKKSPAASLPPLAFIISHTPSYISCHNSRFQHPTRLSCFLVLESMS